MYRKLFVISLGVSFFAVALVQYASAEKYPTKPIEILCPLPAGASQDILSREVADKAAKYLGQRLVVVNRPGAGGAVGSAEVLSSKPDGYKLITLTNIFFSSTLQTQKIVFNPDHLTPIWSFIMYKIGMFVRGDSPWKSLGNLLDDARKRPGQITWGHHGRGLSVQVAASLIFKKAGVNVIEVPHKGSPESMAALLGGHIDVLTTSYGTVSPHVAAGKIRCLVVYSDARYSDRPDVPCAVELGYPDAPKVSTYVGLFAHKDIPGEYKRILMDAMKKTCEEPDFKKAIENIGEERVCGGPEFMREKIENSTEVIVPILKELGIYVERK